LKIWLFQKKKFSLLSKILNVQKGNLFQGPRTKGKLKQKEVWSMSQLWKVPSNHYFIILTITIMLRITILLLLFRPKSVRRLITKRSVAKPRMPYYDEIDKRALKVHPDFSFFVPPLSMDFFPAHEEASCGLDRWRRSISFA